MEEVFKKIFDGKSDEELSSFLVNLNKFWLNRKDHIKIVILLDKITEHDTISVEKSKEV